MLGPSDKEFASKGEAFQQLRVEREEIEHYQRMGFDLGGWLFDC